MLSGNATSPGAGAGDCVGVARGVAPGEFDGSGVEVAVALGDADGLGALTTKGTADGLFDGKMATGVPPGVSFVAVSLG